MATKRGRKPKAKETNSQSLIDALKFISVAQKESEQAYTSHCRLTEHWALASDGILSAGHKIEEDLDACPHTGRLLAALSKCGPGLALSQDEMRLAVRSEKFRATIPCIDPAALIVSNPDAPCAVIDDRLKAAFQQVAPLVSETADFVAGVSVLLRAGSVVSTNRHVIIEAWHGIDLPPNLALPKAFMLAVMRCQKPLARFGFSDRSVTFYFDDESWLKTQLYEDKWPNVDGLLNQQANPWPLPENLFAAVDAVLPFSDNSFVFFHQGSLQSHYDATQGATYEIEGLPNERSFNGKYLKLLDGLATQIDFGTGREPLRFFGENVRGCIAPGVLPSKAESSYNDNEFNKDISF